MNSSPWSLEEVDGGEEQYPVESRFAVRHTPPDEQDPCFDRRAPTQVRFLRFAVRHTHPGQEDPISTVGGPGEVCFLHFAVHQTPPDEHDPISNVVGRTQGRFLLRYASPRFHRLFRPSGWLPMNNTRSVASR